MERYEYAQELSGKLNVSLGQIDDLLRYMEELLRVTPEGEREYLDMILGLMVPVIKEGRMDELVNVISDGFPDYIIKPTGTWEK